MEKYIPEEKWRAPALERKERHKGDKLPIIRRLILPPADGLTVVSDSRGRQYYRTPSGAIRRVRKKK